MASGHTPPPPQAPPVILSLRVQLSPSFQCSHSSPDDSRLRRRSLTVLLRSCLPQRLFRRSRRLGIEGSVLAMGCPRTQALQRSMHMTRETWIGGSPRESAKRRIDENRRTMLLVWPKVVGPDLHYVSAVPFEAQPVLAVEVESLVSRLRMTRSRAVTMWTASRVLRLW